MSHLTVSWVVAEGMTLLVQRQRTHDSQQSKQHANHVVNAICTALEKGCLACSARTFQDAPGPRPLSGLPKHHVFHSVVLLFTLFCHFQCI